MATSVKEKRNILGNSYSFQILIYDGRCGKKNSIWRFNPSPFSTCLSQRKKKVFQKFPSKQLEVATFALLI